MSFSFNSQIKKLKDEADITEYSIQITTDNKEQYLFMQEMARQCVDGNHKEKQGDTETFDKHYVSLPFDSKKSYQYDIPNCCKDCSNHPSNGGSGICACTLPYFEQGSICTSSNTTKLD